jgi:spermidine synthase
MFDEWPHTHVEKAGRGRGIVHQLKRPWLFEGEETFPELGGMKQIVQIGEFEEFGRGLVIDGMAQLAEAIEPAYTSALVFPAATTALSRKRWLIAGGGDGAAPREALAFRETEHVKLVDLSRTVLEKTQELIPSFWGGCQYDPRLEIITRDVFAVMREMVSRGEQVDIIISDLTDPEDPEYTPFAESTADHLYTEAGLRLFAECLAPDGVFAMQAQELSPLRWEGHRRLRQLLAKVFRRMYSYRVFIEFFGYWQSFLIADNATDIHYHYGERGYTRHQAQDLWVVGYNGTLGDYWDHEVRAALFAIPPKLYEAIER